MDGDNIAAFRSIKMTTVAALRFLSNSCSAIIALAVIVSVFSFSPNAFGQDDEDGSGEAIALFNKGQDAHERGEFTVAIENYDKALKLIPEFPEAQLQRANAFQSLGKFAEAESAFRRSLELREDWSLAMAGLGAVLVRRNNFAEAEKFLTRAIEIDELNFPAYAAMTELRLKTKASDEVLKTLLAKLRNLSAKANPTASTWASRAALESKLGDNKTALMSAAKALELDPKYQYALSTSADIALIEHDPASADVFVRRLEALAPDTESTKGLRARVLVEQGKIDDATALLNTITNPGQEIADLKRQLVAASTTDVATLESQLVSDPRNAVALGKLCAAFRVGDPAKALEYCRRASEAEPNSVQPVIGYAAALVQAKRYDDAVLVLRRILTIAPSNSTVRANLATALFQLKRYPEAKVEFRWLTEQKPDLAIAYYFLAIIHDNLLEFVDAAANYQQFLRLADPDSSKLEVEKVNLRLPIVQKLIKDGKGKKRG